METTTLEKSKKTDAELDLTVGKTTAVVSSFAITTDQELQQADALLLTIAQQMAEVHDAFDELVESAYDNHKKAVAKRKKYLDPLTTAKETIAKVRGAYIKIVEDARRVAEAQARAQAEANARAQREAHDREVAAQRQRDEDARVNRAAELEAQGKTELAEHVLSAPPSPPPPPPPPPVYHAPIHYAAPTKTAGVSSRDNWKAQIETEPMTARAQLLTLVKAAALDPDRLLHFLTLNASALNQHAKQTKGAVAVPGISFVNDVSTSVRTAGRG